MPHKVCFRGDGRHPTAFGSGGSVPIFSGGFKKRDQSKQISTRGMGPYKAGDIDPTSAVCVSARISAAALFPLFCGAQPPPEPNFLYMMGIDTSHLYNTHKVQAEVALNSPLLRYDPKGVAWPLFAQEIAADSVAAGEIIAAVSFTRSFFGKSWSDGGTYTLGKTLLLNDKCTVPEDVRKTALSFLRAEVMEHGNNQPLPTLESGFHISDPYGI